MFVTIRWSMLNEADLYPQCSSCTQWWLRLPYTLMPSPSLDANRCRRAVHGLPQRHDPRSEYYAIISTQYALLYRMVGSPSLQDGGIGSHYISSCGVPAYANAITAKCKQCEKDIPLRLNPRLVSIFLLLARALCFKRSTRSVLADIYGWILGGHSHWRNGQYLVR